MRILFFTHRFGQEVVGGAELHLWKLAEHLARLGCQVEVATTSETDIHPFLRFGLIWSHPQSNRIENLRIPGAKHPVRIIRFPVHNLWKPLAAVYQKHLQHRWEKEEMAMPVTSLQPMPNLLKAPLLLTGWHLPEPAGNRSVRWTMAHARIRFPETREASLMLRAFAPRLVRVHLERGPTTTEIFRGKGSFEINVPLVDLPAGTATLHVSPTYRPLRDTRTLGIQVSQLALHTGDEIIPAPMHVDHRNLRAQNKRNFIETYVSRAEARSGRYSWLFDQLRGPRCPGMERFLEENIAKYDWVLAGIFPFANITTALRVHRRHPFRLALLPLFHVDDDFYYWQHYFDAMREADICLANSIFSHEVFFPYINAPSIPVGAGVDEAIFRNPDINGMRFRKRFGFDPGERIILSVGRKSPSKLYQTVINAVDRIQEETPCRFVLIGPDEDGQPITSPNCSYLGPVSQTDLLDAYDACDIFVLMSESESFGMVFLEAWMREKPVIGNRNCAPVAQLIQEGTDGLLASNRFELEQHLIELLQNPEARRDMGKNGFQKARKAHTWKVISRKLLDYFAANTD